MAKALCVIDYQNDFVSGSLGSDEAKLIKNALRLKIAEYMNRGDEILYTCDVHNPDEYDLSCEGRHIPVRHCLNNTAGCDFDPSIKDLTSGCRIFYKSGFASEDLAEYLRQKNFDSVEFVGVATNICVLCNAVLARTVLPNASIIIDHRCVASYDKSLGEAALKVLESICVDIL